MATARALALLAACAAPLAAAEERVYFKPDLLFYASYDRSLDADLARGDRQPLKSKGEEFVEGRFGKALRFAAKAKPFCEYRAKGNVRHDRGTVAFHFKPEWSGAEFIHRFFFFHPGAKNPHGGANSPDSMGVLTMRYRKPDQEIWLWYDDHGGGNNIVRGNIAAWRQGEWHHVAVTWDPEWLRIYFDGVLSGQSRVKGRITDPGATFFVGSSRNGHAPSCGTLDEFCIYGRALSLAEIGILTGKPELRVPRIHTMAATQRLFFRGERRVAFRCVLTGLIDPQKHRLRATLLRKGTAQPVAEATLPAATGQHALAAPRWAEGAYTLRVVLADGQGKKLDERAEPLRVIDGPFDR